MCLVIVSTVTDTDLRIPLQWPLIVTLFQALSSAQDILSLCCLGHSYTPIHPSSLRPVAIYPQEEPWTLPISDYISLHVLSYPVIQIHLSGPQQCSEHAWILFSGSAIFQLYYLDKAIQHFQALVCSSENKLQITNDLPMILLSQGITVDRQE